MRIKGLVAVRGSRNKFTLQVTGISYGMEETSELWWNQDRKCVLFFMSTSHLDVNLIRKALLQTQATEGRFEACYWWIDSHCCLTALIVLMLSSLFFTGMIAAMDFGYIPSLLPV